MWHNCEHCVVVPTKQFKTPLFQSGTVATVEYVYGVCVCFFFSWYIYIYILIRDIRRLRCRERRQSPGGTTVSLFTTGVTNTHVCSHLTNVLACTEPYAKECYSNNLLADVCVCACRFVFVFIRLE